MAVGGFHSYLFRVKMAGNSSMQLTRCFGYLWLLAALLFPTHANATESAQRESAASRTELEYSSEQIEAADSRPTLALIVSEFEYKSDTTLPPFAEQHFSKDFRIKSAINADEHCHELPGIDILRDADVAILVMWRRALPPEQLDVVKQYVAAGKPLVALRTTAHAFHTRDGSTPEGMATWPTFDQDVLGGHYQGHHNNHAQQGDPPTYVWALGEAQNHPLLSGIAPGEFVVPSWLYIMQPLKEGATPLIMGRVADREPHEPVAWTYETDHGGRVFYTSLGAPEDFKLPQFISLLRNAVYWAANRPVLNESANSAAAASP
jgi:type 1 glutamine amidotransferase